ncbi:MAG: hypothetical protein Kow0026_14350 [Oricola sp.]
MRAILHNLVLAFAGYALAVFVATCVCVALMVVSDVASSGFGQRPNFIVGIPVVFGFGLAITACTAWPGFIATLAVSRWRGCRGAAYFGLCGAATAIVAVMLFAAYLHDPTFATGLLARPMIYLAGLAGGFSFWLYDRRFCVFV